MTENNAMDATAKSSSSQVSPPPPGTATVKAFVPPPSFAAGAPPPGGNPFAPPIGGNPFAPPKLSSPAPVTTTASPSSTGQTLPAVSGTVPIGGNPFGPPPSWAGGAPTGFVAGPTAPGAAFPTGTKTYQSGVPSAVSGSVLPAPPAPNTNTAPAVDTVYDFFANPPARKLYDEDDHCSDTSRTNSSSEDDSVQVAYERDAAAAFNSFPPSKILDFLYLGNKKNAQDAEFLEEKGITDIINVGSSRYEAPLPYATVHHFNAEDTSDFPIISLFDDVFAVLDRCRQRYMKSRIEGDGGAATKSGSYAQQQGSISMASSAEEDVGMGSSAAGAGLALTPPRPGEYSDESPLPTLENTRGTDDAKLPCVLLHCEKGISRSASVTIGYLMRRNGWTVVEAYHYVEARRRIIQPNAGFMEALRQYEKALNVDANAAAAMQKKRKALVCALRNVRADATETEVKEYYETNVGCVWTVNKMQQPVNAAADLALANAGATAPPAPRPPLWMVAFAMLESTRDSARLNRRIPPGRHPLSDGKQRILIAGAGPSTRRQAPAREDQQQQQHRRRSSMGTSVPEEQREGMRRVNTTGTSATGSGSGGSGGTSPDERQRRNKEDPKDDPTMQQLDT